jgi:cell wall assembly regulator SMI1
MSPSENVKTAHHRITTWLRNHPQARHILPSFNKPATAQAIADFEAKTKLKLPESVAALYLLHDGQDEDAANDALEEDTGLDSIESGLFPSIESGDLAFLLVPLDELARNTPKNARSSRMPGFRLGWLPIGDNYGGDNIVVDLAESTPPAKRGRVLQFNHEYGGAYQLAGSFEAYLASIADGLEKKRIAFDDDAGLSYKKGKDWDDLIDAGKVEYEEEIDGGD